MNKTSHACAAFALLVAAIPACGEVARTGSYDEDSEKGSSGDSAHHPTDPSSTAKPPYTSGAGSGGTTGSYNPGPSYPTPPPYTGPSSADAGAPAPGQPQMMPPNSGDKYRPPGTNPFVMATHDPFSTFGVDVDTASYDIFRRDVNLGMLPQSAGVRLEEYVNAFKYDYPAPTAQDEAPFHIAVNAAAQVFDRETLLLRVGIQGRKPPAYEKRPANLVFLVDTSGSMHSPEKLPLVQKTLLETLEYLSPNDRVSIVSYAGDTNVRLHSTQVANRPIIAQTIDGLESGGSTAGAAGLMLAYEQAQANFIADGINHVLLCTDGDFNVGPSSNIELLRLIREKRKTGITLTVLGYGIGNLNDSMMEEVSDAGNGIYGVISDEAQMKRYVRERMLSTIVRIAKDVKIQVEFNPASVAAYRLLGYEDRDIADMDFRNDAIDAGEIGAGHQVTALYEVVLAGGKVPVAAGAPTPLDGVPSTLAREASPDDLVLVKVRWKTVDATEATPAREVVTALGKGSELSDLQAADPDLQWASAVASFAEILKKSPFASPQRLPAIASIVAAQASRDEDRAEFARLFTRASTQLAH
jgi:Ca-activated chloride channel family protein